MRVRTQRHVFSYGPNDPVAFTDPTGLTWKDKRYGYPDEFWRWFHRRYKRKGDPDADRETVEEAYEEWKRFEKKPKTEPPPADADDPENEGDEANARFCVPCQINRINRAVNMLVLQAAVDSATGLLRTYDLIVNAVKNAKPCGCGSDAVKKLEVSVDVSSTEARLRELQRAFSVLPSDGSHDLGDAHPDGSTWGVTRLRITSSAPDNAPLELHIEKLKDELLNAGRSGVPLPEGCEITLDIAVFHDAPNVTVEIPLRAISSLPLVFDSVHVSSYTCEHARAL